MFTRVLVANRGEIAVRIIRTLREMGIESVAVHSRRDARSAHVECADAAALLPDTDATGGYLDIAAVVAAAVRHGCDALHPGYGFLSENPGLVEACAAANVVFIGPSAQSMRALGDKDQARRAAVQAGVPVVPGAADIQDAATMPTPVLIKPVAGGGGKGMHVVNDIADLVELAQRAGREALAAFGDGRLIFERYLPRARHIEVQVAALADGRVLALGDRECTLQRRHQKVVEEAPAPEISDEVRRQIHAAAAAVIEHVGYRNLATVEFVMSCDDSTEFYFLEVNTRLQVEHPVTEAVTGLDLVELQLRIAAAGAIGDEGDVPAVSQAAQLISGGVTPPSRGHAIEARIYAEDPSRGFLPSGGRLIRWRMPSGDGIRVDSGAREGDVIGSGYDPMIAKVIVSGESRANALRALDAALADTVVLGLSTNTGFLRELIARPEVQSARMDTRLIDRITAEDTATVQPMELPDHVQIAWALTVVADSDLLSASAWAGGWRHSLPSTIWCHGAWNRKAVAVSVVVGADGYTARVAERACSITNLRREGDWLDFEIDGEPQRWIYARVRTPDGDATWLANEAQAWCIDHRRYIRDAAVSGTTSPQVRSPMPGTVVQVLTSLGSTVVAGQPLLVLEAMKMEHQVRAPHDGVVRELNCTSGAHVRLQELLVVVETAP